MTTKKALVTGIVLLALVAQGIGSTSAAIITCVPTGNDNLDRDFDGLSDKVEETYLGTSPCAFDDDGDGIKDGLDAVPQAKAAMPLSMNFVSINMVDPADGCDPSPNHWDPYFTAFDIEIPVLGEQADIDFVGWTYPGLVWDKPNQNNNPTVASNAGSGVTSGSTLNFQIDPDLTNWDGSLSSLQLKVDFGILLVDRDEARHDTMEFNIDPQDIVSPKMTGLKLRSLKAYDSNTASINCQAEVTIHTQLHGLSAAIINTYEAQGSSGGGMIRCTTPGMNNCRPTTGDYGALSPTSYISVGARPGINGVTDDDNDPPQLAKYLSA